MSAPEPTRDEARAAVAEATAAASAVRSSDRYFLVVLLVLATGYLAAMLVLAQFRLLSPFFIWLVCLLLAPMMFAVRSWQRRQQLAFTAAARVAFEAAGWSFVVWNAILITWAAHAGWLGTRSDWHSVVVSVASVVPLLAGIAYIGRRR
ncbi:MAG TPA: hypothetical protein VGX22_00575 [Candidatus Dormibacteraeota bacterium]|nr:hypothetical protein [Candidatus Dormibacteraeota bacterium]